MTEDTDKKEKEGEMENIQINWDDSNMSTTYANVVNAASTREEVAIFFGTNQTWNPNNGKDVNVRLEERIILNPHAAKRLAVLLTGIVKQYEGRYGKLSLERAVPKPAQTN